MTNCDCSKYKLYHVLATPLELHFKNMINDCCLKVECEDKNYNFNEYYDRVYFVGSVIKFKYFDLMINLEKTFFLR